MHRVVVFIPTIHHHARSGPTPGWVWPVIIISSVLMLVLIVDRELGLMERAWDAMDRRRDQRRRARAARAAARPNITV